MKDLQKHPYNVYPDLSKDDRIELQASLLRGYDPTLPIYLCDDMVIDGWQRYQICKKEGINPVFEHLLLEPMEIVEFIIRTNSRRNLTSGAKAGISLKYKDIIEGIKAEAKKRQGTRTDLQPEQEQHRGTSSSKSETPTTTTVQKNEGKKTDQILAKTFGTNKKYIQEARRLEKDDPELLQKVIDNEISMKRVILDRQKKDSFKKKVTKSKNDPFFSKTQRMGFTFGDNVQQILQGNHIPKTKEDYKQIHRLNRRLYRIIVLSAEAGVDIEAAYKGLTKKKSIVISTPSHLQIPEKFKDILEMGDD